MDSQQHAVQEVDRSGLPRIYTPAVLKENRSYILCRYIESRTATGKPRVENQGILITIKEVGDDEERMLMYEINGKIFRESYFTLRSIYVMYGPTTNASRAKIISARDRALSLLRQAIETLENEDDSE